MDIRNVALSPRSAQLLEGINAWPAAAACYQRMYVWEERGVEKLEFAAAEVGQEALGWLVEVSPLLDALWHAVDNEPLVSVELGEVAGVETRADGADLLLHAPGARARIAADLIVAADGANSAVRRALGVHISTMATGDVALTTVVRAQYDHQDTAWQRFLLGGPLALLPSVHADQCSIVWSQSAACAEHHLAMSEQRFCQALSRASEYRLGQILECAQRQAFPLSQQLAATALPHPRVLLIGDALRVVHPLAGLGVNLGFEDLEHLLQVAQHADDLGQPRLWLKFARARHLRSKAMLHLLDGLRRIYAGQTPLAGWVRNVGVSMFAGSGGLKRQVMEQAMGLERRFQPHS